MLRNLASLIGTLNSSAHAILPAPLQYRYLQDQLIRSLAKCPDYDKSIILDNQSKMEITWWIQNLTLHNGNPIHINPPDLIITSDAAKQGGLAATCLGKSTGRQWNKFKNELHINQQELLAAKYALRCYLKGKGTCLSTC